MAKVDLLYVYLKTQTEELKNLINFNKKILPVELQESKVDFKSIFSNKLDTITEEKILSESNNINISESNNINNLLIEENNCEFNIDDIYYYLLLILYYQVELNDGLSIVDELPYHTL